MSIKCIFSDIDGTLIDKDLILPGKNIEAINCAVNKGIKFIIHSGRLLCSSFEYAKQLEALGKENEYIIAGNGALIVNGKLETIYENYMSETNIKTLFEYLYSLRNLSFSLVSIDKYYWPILIEPTKPLTYRDYFVDIDKNELLDKVGKEKFYKFLIQGKDEERLNKIIEEIPILTNNQMYGAKSSRTCIEVVSNDVSKGKAISIMCKHLNINEEDTLAIGDNYNDMSMTETKGKFACPNNSIKELKEIADYVSPLNCKDGAVADIIHHYLGE